MNTKHKNRSTRHDLIISLSVLFAAAIFIVLLVYGLSTLSSRWKSYRVAQDSLTNYLESKKYTFTSNILLNLDEASNLKKERMIEEDGVQIYLFKFESAVPATLLNSYCHLNSGSIVNTCVDYSSNIVRAWYPLDHSGTIYGYMIAEKRFDYKAAWLNSKTLFLICIALLFVYLTAIAIVFKKLDIRILRPLEDIADSLQPLTHASYDIKFRDYESGEMNILARRLESVVKDAGTAQRKLVEYEKDAAIGRMAAQIAHDIRNPLSAVQYFVKTDHSKLTVDQQIAFTETATQCLKKLTDMAEELLDFSKANRIEKKKVDFNELVARTIKEVKASTGKSNVTFEYNKLDDPSVYIDEAKINRVLNNLISNSIQASTDGGKIVIKSYVDSKGLTVSLKDTGKGIPPQYLQRIFDSEFTYDKDNGTGLGLAYCESVIKAHGGNISVNSETGKGTEFIITVPK